MNTYLMLKRFVHQWNDVWNDLGMNSKAGLDVLLDAMKPIMPTVEDHEGAKEAIFRLQTTYNLDAKSIVAGTIQGIFVLLNSMIK